MNRRTLIKKLAGQEKESNNAFAPSYDFSPYPGPWREEQAAHLLRRTTFAPTLEDIEWSVRSGLSGTINSLFRDLPLQSPPVNRFYPEDPDVPRGKTWVNAPYRNSHYNTQKINRENNLMGWHIRLMLELKHSIREKLVLFWHNHFPINQILDPVFKYKYIATIRRNALGNFKKLTKEITIDPAMLRFLNGNQNRKQAPNENYARELLELFTIGKGPQVAPGDYTHYTESDIREIARILTGWQDTGFGLESLKNRAGSRFVRFYHDEGQKTLSHRFGNAVIPNLWENEYTYLIDKIFEQEEVSRFICRRLYTWFVYYRIDSSVEDNIIEPMARIVRQDNFQISRALQRLLSSTHFFDRSFYGAMIKSPVDWILSAVRGTNAPMPSSEKGRDLAGYLMKSRMQYQSQSLYEIPEVAGWKAYYLDPVYYRHWISSTTIRSRLRFIRQLVGSPGVGSTKYGITIFLKVDYFSWISGFSNPLDPNDLIEDMAKRLLPRPLTSSQLSILKEALIPGLPDFEWTVEYGNYLDNPGNRELARSVRRRLESLLSAIFSMPECHLS